MRRRELMLFDEQARVLHRDDRLRREVLQQRDLPARYMACADEPVKSVIKNKPPSRGKGLSGRYGAVPISTPARNRRDMTWLLYRSCARSCLTSLSAWPSIRLGGYLHPA